MVCDQLNCNSVQQTFARPRGGGGGGWAPPRTSMQKYVARLRMNHMAARAPKSIQTQKKGYLRPTASSTASPTVSLGPIAGKPATPRKGVAHSGDKHSMMAKLRSPQDAGLAQNPHIHHRGKSCISTGCHMYIASIGMLLQPMYIHVNRYQQTSKKEMVFFASCRRR